MEDEEVRPADVEWASRRKLLIEALTPVIRARYPLATWQQLMALVGEAADMQLIHERFNHEQSR